MNLMCLLLFGQWLSFSLLHLSFAPSQSFAFSTSLFASTVAALFKFAVLTVH